MLKEQTLTLNKKLMPTPSGNNKTNKTHRNKIKKYKRKVNQGTIPTPAKSYVNIAKTTAKVHKKIHESSEGVRKATRAMTYSRKV
jgi:hypothetical protein